MDPFSAGMFASIGSALKFADVAVRISEVGSENAVFVRTIYVVRSDLEEVERLLSLDVVQKKLAGTPGKLPWVKTAIFNTRSALNEIGKWVERARVEQETTGSIKFDTRVRWVFNDHEKLLNRKTELSTCHQQLSNVLSYLIRLEDVPVNPAPLEYENVNHFDEIMSRHRRATGPKARKAEVSTTTSARETVAGSTTAPLVHPTAVLPASNPSSGQVTTAYDQRGSVRSPSISSTLSSPGSPPPTYAAAVSTEPFLHDTRLHVHSSTDQKSPLDQFVNRRLAPQNKNDSIWAYRNDFEGIAIPELPGDAVSFNASATNPAGPVNPYEFYNKLRAEPFGAKVKSYRPCENLAEMLGDLHFSAELPSHDPGPPPGYPPRTRARSDQLGLSPSTYTQSRRRTASEIPVVVHRRPVPANSHSDSLFVSSQIPTSFPVQKAIPSGIEQVPQPYMTRPVANELATQGSHQSYMQHRPSSYSNAQSAFWAAGDSSSQSSRHISAPPLLPLASNVNVAAYSAESTGSWGLDTQPRVSKQQPTRGPPAATTRMQRQKHLLSLLGSIDR